MLPLLLAKHIQYADVLERLLPHPKGFSEEYFSQTLDHFTPTNFSTFNQRFYVNDEFYSGSGVAIIHIGGEGELKDTSVLGKYSGYFFAQNMSALLVSLEHRFYGKSSPEVTPSDLEFLTTEQAIADYSTFIPYIKQKYNVNKVMVMGGSYPGSMAAILRAQLPHLVDAALSSSAPVLAKYDYFEYLRHVQAQFDEETRDALEEAYEWLSGQAESAENWPQLCEDLNIEEEYCDFADQLDRIELYETFTDAVAGVVQYAKPAGYDGVLEVGEIDEFSSEIKACGNDLCVLEVLNTFGGSCAGCDHIDYNTMVSSFEETVVDSGRMWYFETCSEYAYYQSAQYEESIFLKEISLEYFSQVCLDAFFRPMGIANTLEEAQLITRQAVDSSNFQKYGARNQPRDKIWYTVGSVDPWTELAMDDALTWEDGKYRHFDTKMEVIPYGSHCSDMYLEWVVNDGIRQQQLITFRKWLGLD